MSRRSTNHYQKFWRRWAWTTLIAEQTAWWSPDSEPQLGGTSASPGGQQRANTHTSVRLKIIGWPRALKYTKKGLDQTLQGLHDSHCAHSNWCGWPNQPCMRTQRAQHQITCRCNHNSQASEGSIRPAEGQTSCFLGALNGEKIDSQVPLQNVRDVQNPYQHQEEHASCQTHQTSSLRRTALPR